MKAMRTILVSATFAGFILFGCSDKETSPETLPYCESDEFCEPGDSSNSDNSSNSTSSSSVRLSSSSARPSSSSFANPYPTLVQGQNGVMTGWASRYWDGCKPSCSWKDKQQAPLGGTTRAKTCSVNGTSEIAANDDNKSSCDGGNSYTCFDQVPYIVSQDLAYAFAATPGNGNQCGKCYQIQFDGGFEHGTPYATHNAIRGKTLIVMSSNIGGDVSGGQFDLLIPGGGVGIFNSFSSQIGVDASALGKQYGGLLSDCEDQLQWANGTLAQYQECLRGKCNSLFGSKNSNLLNGCLFYANWAMAANNPKHLYKEVTCPQYLIDKYKATMF